MQDGCPFPHHPDQLTVAWLTRCLRQSGVLSVGAVREIDIELNAKWNIAHTAYVSIEYESEVSGTPPRRLFVKIAQAADPLQAVFRGEGAFYREISTKALPLAQCYGVFDDGKTNFISILLEDFSKTHHTVPWPDMPAIEHCEQAVTTLARLHACWWCAGSEQTDALKPVLLANEQRIKGFFEPLFVSFLNDFKEHLDRRQRDLVSCAFRRVADLKSDRVCQGKPITRTHGDPHFWNFLYPDSAPQHDCILVDWEDWRMDMAAADLASMLILHCCPDHREKYEKRLLEHYLDELGKGIGDGDHWESFIEDYRLGHLQNIVVPVFHHHSGHSAESVWRYIERWLTAFETLDCDTLL